MHNEGRQPHRVAIYYAPDPQSEWWRTGSSWLGRCAQTNRSLDQPALRAVTPDDFRRLTAEPRRYGWHATLKAPFQLAQGCDLNHVRAALQRFCRGRTPFELAPLQVTRMDGFLALRPLPSQPVLDQLAADCVQQLHALAAPLSESELARRRQAGLTSEQDALLRAWGYPWVLQHFHFHLSLTGPLEGLPPEALEGLIEEAAHHFHRLPPCRVDRLSIFIEPAPGADFMLHEQVEFQP